MALNNPRNRLLSVLTEPELALLSKHLTLVDLELGETLHRHGEPIVYMCSTTKTAAPNLSGSEPINACRASTPPSDAPMTTTQGMLMLRRCCGLHPARSTH